MGDVPLTEYLDVLKKRKAVILWIVLPTIVVSIIVSLLLQHIYLATTTLMPVKPATGSAMLPFSSLTAIPGLGRLSGILGGEDVDKLTNILQSRKLMVKVIGLNDLLHEFFRDDWDAERRTWRVKSKPDEYDTVRYLRRITTITNDKTDLITVSVRYRDPDIAANIANSYVIALDDYLKESNFSAARKNRLFVEEQMASTQEALHEAEEKLNEFQKEHGMVSLDAQTTAAVETAARIKGDLIMAEVELDVLQKFATREAREYKQAKAKVEELGRQLDKLQGPMAFTEESETTEAASGREVFPTLGEVPDLGLQYGRLMRDFKVQETLYELLEQQYQLARIEEQKSDIQYQVIDPAVPPDERVWPKRKLIVVFATLLSLAVGVFVTFAQEWAAKTSAKAPA